MTEKKEKNIEIKKKKNENVVEPTLIVRLQRNNIIHFNYYLKKNK